MSKGEGDVKVMDVGDPSASAEPRVIITRQENFNPAIDVHGATCELYYFYPAGSLWSASAKTFGGFRSVTGSNAHDCFANLIEHNFYLAQKLACIRFEGDTQYVTWTVVPRRDSDAAAGYLLRFIYRVQADMVGATIVGQLEAAQTRYVKQIEKARQKAPQHGPIKRYQHFRYRTYEDTVRWYLMSTSARLPPTSSSALFQELGATDNPWNPFRVFSLEMALEKMNAAKARFDFINPANFRVPDTADLIPLAPENGTNMFLLDGGLMDPIKFRNVMLPHVPRKIDVDADDFQQTLQEMMAKVRDDDESVDSEAGPGQGFSREQAFQMAVEKYKQSARLAQGIEAHTTLEGFKKEVAARKRMCRLQANGDPVKERELWRVQQQELAIICERDVITDDDTADCGNAVRAIAKWKESFLRSHRNLMMPRAKQTWNLSRYGDMQSSETCTMESVFQVAYAHQEVKSLRLASMHVYFYSPFQLHTALIGEQGSGKSNAFGINLERLIPDTYHDLAAESSKAKMTSGKASDLMIEVFEDINPAAIGVQVNGAVRDGTNNMTSNTSEEAALKYRLTKGRVRGAYKRVSDGKHETVYIDSFCNTVMLFGANVPAPKIPSSIADRFNVVSFPKKTRLDASGSDQGMLYKFQESKRNNMSRLKEDWFLRDCRNQFLIAFAAIMCWSGAMEMPDMTVPFLLWAETLKRAKECGLHDTNNTRHYDRMNMMGEVQTIERAIDIVFDSEVSPLDINASWHPTHILELEKHLYGDTETASFVMGMMQHQYEWKIVEQVESWMKTSLLKDKIRMRQIGRPTEPNPQARQEMSYYYLVPASGMVSTGSSYGSNRFLQPDDHLRAFAKLCSRSIKQPEIDVRFALETMSSQMLQVPKLVDGLPHPSEKETIPALSVTREGEIMIAVAQMKNHRKNRLRDCFRDVVSHQYTKKKNILWGRTRDSTPYVWQSMKIEPMAGKQLLMQKPSFHSQAVLQQTYSALSGVHASAHPSLEDERNAQIGILEDRFMAMFSDTNQKVVDMDLDVWASEMRARQLGLTDLPDTMPDAPGYVTTSNVLRLACLQRANSERLGHHPVCFEETQPAMYGDSIRQDQIANPHKYSLKHSTEVSSRKRKREEIDAQNGGEGVSRFLGESQVEEEEEADEGEVDGKAHEYLSDGDIDDHNADDNADDDDDDNEGDAMVCGGRTGGGGAVKMEIDAPEGVAPSTAPPRVYATDGLSDDVLQSMFDQVGRAGMGRAQPAGVVYDPFT